MAEIPETIRIGKEAKDLAEKLAEIYASKGFLDDVPAIMQASLRDGLKNRIKKLERNQK